MADDTATEEDTDTPQPSEDLGSWWNTHDNILVLIEHLRDQGGTADEIVQAVEKPWKFEDEYREALEELGE